MILNSEAKCSSFFTDNFFTQTRILSCSHSSLNLGAVRPLKEWKGGLFWILIFIFQVIFLNTALTSATQIPLCRRMLGSNQGLLSQTSNHSARSHPWHLKKRNIFVQLDSVTIFSIFIIISFPAFFCAHWKSVLCTVHCFQTLTEICMRQDCYIVDSDTGGQRGLNTKSYALFFLVPTKSLQSYG